MPPRNRPPSRRRQRTTEKRPGWVTLAVSDDGCGLPAGLGERIFEPFVTTKETGLAICRRIAEAQGGRLTAANGTVGGAVLTVQLPVAGDSVSLQAAGEPPPAAVCEGGSHAHAAGD